MQEGDLAAVEALLCPGAGGGWWARPSSKEVGLTLRGACRVTSTRVTPAAVRGHDVGRQRGQGARAGPADAGAGRVRAPRQPRQLPHVRGGARPRQLRGAPRGGPARAAARGHAGGGVAPAAD